ncbi:MAG: glycosyltransferase family 4 protein [Clostridia bacterium]
MKVAINGLLISNENAGIGRYGYNLINSLIKADSVDYTLFLQRSAGIDHKDIESRGEFKRSYQRILDEQIFLPLSYRNFDLVHFIDYSSPYFKMNIPFITTIHDLTYFKFPETFSYGSQKIKVVLAPLSIKRSAIIIADSENTRNDISEMFPDVKDKVRVVYPGRPDFKEVKDKKLVEDTKRKYDIKGEYIMTVGTLEPRKNLKSLIKAYKLVHERIKDINLVIVGKKGWLYKEVFELLEEDKFRDAVIFTGYVAQEDLPCLYSGAQCFVYPSIYEGFGLPPLEAMCCGTPVVVSNTSSLPEVVGEAGVYVKPIEIESIFDGIMKVLNDSGLRQTLISNGYKQVKKFDWDLAARQVIDIYKEILE